MARFAGTMQAKGRVDKSCYSGNSIEAHIRGWNFGVRVIINPSREDDEKDEVRVYVTGGSNNSLSSRLVAYLEETKVGGTDELVALASHSREEPYADDN